MPYAKLSDVNNPDFRGHGRTTSVNLLWDSRKIADDMAQFLDALKIGCVHLIGYSCGAYVGCYMASKYPDKIKSLVTIGGGTYPRPNGTDDYLPEKPFWHLSRITGKSAAFENL